MKIERKEVVTKVVLNSCSNITTLCVKPIETRRIQSVSLLRLDNIYIGCIDLEMIKENKLY